jgi:hypothetical protein
MSSVEDWINAGDPAGPATQRPAIDDWINAGGSAGASAQPALLAQARKNAGPGASEQEIRELAARMGPKPPAPVQPATPEPPSPERSLLARFGRGVVMPAQGFNQGIADTVGGLGDVANAGFHAIGQSDLPSDYFTKLATRLLVGDPGSERRLTPENTVERGLEGAGRGAGNAASMAVGGQGIAALRGLPLVGPGASTFGDFMRAAPATQVAAGAAGGGATEATGDPNYGLAASLATPVGLLAARKLVQPISNQRTPEGKALVQEADKLEIPLSAGERTGSGPMQLVESQFERYPFTSGPQKAIKQEQQSAIDRASLAASETKSNVASPEVLDSRFKQLGDRRDDLADHNTLNLNQQVPNSAAPPRQPGQPHPTTDLYGEIINYNDKVRRDTGLTPAIEAVKNQTHELLLHVKPGDTVDGQLYRKWDTQIREAIDKADNGDTKQALRGLRNLVQDGMGQGMSPPDAAEWKQINRNFANLYVTADAVGGAGGKAAEGHVPPKALRQAVINSVGEIPYTRGVGDQNKLARIGQDIVADPVGDSGTAGREYVNKLLTGAPLMIGAAGGLMGGGVTGGLVGAGLGLGLPPLIQAGMNSRPGQAYLARGIPGARNLVPQNPSSTVGNITRAMAGRLLDERQRENLQRQLQQLGGPRIGLE